MYSSVSVVESPDVYVYVCLERTLVWCASLQAEITRARIAFFFYRDTVRLNLASISFAVVALERISF